MKIFFIFLFMVYFAYGSAKADIVNEMFRIECIPEMNVLIISDFFDNGYLPEASLKENSEILAKKYGIYDYFKNIVVILNDVQSHKAFETTCTLKTEDDINSKKTETYFIKLSGRIQNLNPAGHCGGWRSFDVTLSTKDNIIMKEIPFVENCYSSRSIEKISVYPHEGYAQINKKGNTSVTLWFRDGPFTLEKIYPEEMEP